MLAPSPRDKIPPEESRYRKLFETSHDGILIIDSESGKIDSANRAFENILGFSQKHLLGKQLWQIGVFSNRFDFDTIFLKLSVDGYVRSNDLSIRSKDGRIVDVDLTGNSYTDNDHEFIQCNFREIGDRKLGQNVARARAKVLEKLSIDQENTKKAMMNVMEDLEAAREFIELEKIKDDAILASITDGLIAVDSDLKIMTVNKSAEQMLCIKAIDMVGAHITNLTLENEDGEVLPYNKRPTQMALRTGQAISGTYFFVKKDNTRFPIAITVTPIRVAGKIIGALDTFRDITKEIEIDKAKNDFVAVASHQLRTPSGIIKWYLEALSSEKSFKNSSKVVRKYLDQIAKSNERILSLVNNLLSVSRIEQKHIRNDPKPVGLATVVSETVQQMQAIALKKNVLLKTTIGFSDTTIINIDPLKLYEVMENLIANAIAYTNTAGKVEVTVRRLQNYFSIEVCDTGIGISQIDCKKLFTKFFRSQEAISLNPEGSGLGLYVVRSYVEDWGGKITVRSKEGVGSTFTIKLPINKNLNKSD